MNPMFPRPLRRHFAFFEVVPNRHVKWQRSNVIEMMRRAMGAVGRMPAFVPVFAAFPVLNMAARNSGQVESATVAIVVAVSILVTVNAYVVLRRGARTSSSAGVAASSLVVMFFAFGVVNSWVDATMLPLQQNQPGAVDQLAEASKTRMLLATIWALLAIYCAHAIARSRWAARVDVAKVLTFAGVTLLLVSVVPLASSSTGAALAGREWSRPVVQAASSDVAATAPDIYYIVLDGYARSDVLAKHYGFDNSRFIDGLTSRGFDVADSSSANYTWTFLSLSSTLNLGYLQEVLGRRLDPGSMDRGTVYASIRDNATARFLRQRGYRIVHFQSTWGATAVNPHADHEVKCEQQKYANEFVREVVSASWLGAFRTKANIDLAECHLANFRALGAVARTSGPKFVFAHFLLPHHPYLFDRDGKVLRNSTVSNQFEFQKRLWEDKEGYLSQLEFVNGATLKAIDQILARCDTPPIIVLASDHGPGLTKGLSRTEHAAIRFANLGAYLLPGAPEGLVTESGSAVNVFRSILGFYFAADLPPLVDRYFQSSFKRPFEFHEVSKDELHSVWNERSMSNDRSQKSANLRAPAN